MTREEIFEYLANEVSERCYELRVEDITEESHISDDYGIDSLELTDIECKIERALGIEDNTALDPPVGDDVTIGELVDYYYTHQNKQDDAL